MFAEKTELNLNEDLHETALVELNTADVEEVAGGFLPLVFAAGFAAGYYFARR